MRERKTQGTWTGECRSLRLLGGDFTPGVQVPYPQYIRFIPIPALGLVSLPRQVMEPYASA